MGGDEEGPWQKKALEFQHGIVPKGSSGQMSEIHTQQSRAVGQLGAECELQLIARLPSRLALGTITEKKKKKKR